MSLEESKGRVSGGKAAAILGLHLEIVAEMREADEKLWKEAQPFMGNAPMFRTKPFHEHSKKELVESGIPEWTPPAF